jgi:hypothetical protein
VRLNLLFVVIGNNGSFRFKRHMFVLLSLLTELERELKLLFL